MDLISLARRSLVRKRLLGRTLERDPFGTFLTLPFLRRTDSHIFTCFCGVRALRLIPFWQLVEHLVITDNFQLIKKQLTRFI